MKGGAVNPYGDLIGHLGVRSSPLAPTSSKLTQQHIVLDHLNAHYRMINNAKSTIDNKTPKAWTSSTKVRDRKRRTDVKKGGSARGSRSVPNSRPTSRLSQTSSQSLVDQIEAYQNYFDDDPEVGAIVKSTLPYQHSTPDVYIERANTDDMKFVNQIVDDSYNNPNMYKSPRPMRSMIPDTMKAGSGNPNVATPRRGKAGDLLDDHAHKFRESKPFTPRTLNTKNVKSKLSQAKYYNPPKKRSTSSKGSKEVQEEKFMKTETMNTMATTQDLTFEPLRSKDFNQLSSHREKSANIPRLDISVDQDHMVWLNEQAKKAHARVGSARQDEVTEERATLSHSAKLNHTAGMNSTAGMNHTGGLRTSDTMRASGTYRSGIRAGDVPVASDTLASHRSLGMSHTMQKVDTEEEELQYLQFVSDITSDVLERGIFTNRVLKQVFEQNIEKRKHELKISRMRALLDKLRDDLGIPESDGEGEEDFGLKSHVKLSDEAYRKGTESSVPKSHIRMSEEVHHREMAPPKPQPRAQGRHKFTRVTDEVDNKAPGSGEFGSTGSLKKHVEVTISKKVETINISEPSVRKEQGTSNERHENGVVSDAIVEEDFMEGSEQNSMMSEQEGSVTSNVEDLSTTRSLPQEHKWMKNASNFTMTLKPGQLDMTLVKPKPRSRDHQRLAETVPANPRARRREMAKQNEEKQDELGTTGEISSLTEITAIGENEQYREDKFEVSSVVSDATLKNGSEKGSQQGSLPGSPRGSAHGSVASRRSRGKQNGSVRGSRQASPRGSTHGSTRGSTHGSVASVKSTNQAQRGFASEQGSTGTLQGSLEGSTTFVMAQSINSAPLDSPQPSPRAHTRPSPRGSVHGSQASVHSHGSVIVKNAAENESVVNENTDVDSVFSDHIPGLDSEPEQSPAAGRSAPAYAKKTPNYDGDDDDDF